jgi:PAS domain S-box-containing protein
LQKKIEQNTVFPNSIIGVIVVDENGQIENINNKVVELLGYDKNDLIGSQFSNFIIEADKVKFDDYCSSIDALDNHTTEIRLADFEGHVTHVALELMDPIIAAQKYYVGIIKDIAKKKAKEREVENLKEAKNDALERLEEEKDLSDLKSRFVTTASHEFRTPLAGILSSLQLIQRYLASENKKWNEFRVKGKIETHFHKIEESVTNLTRILDDFLSLGKIESNEIVCKYNAFNLPQFLENLCWDLRQIAKQGQDIECQHFGSESEIYFDQHLLRNIINNLVSNAIKYSSENQAIKLISRVDHLSITIEVQDEGMGIPTSEHTKIFRRFFRAGNALNYQGTGLGLSIVKKYTELLGGEITFESQENRGATFRIIFPIYDKISAE